MKVTHRVSGPFLLVLSVSLFGLSHQLLRQDIPPSLAVCSLLIYAALWIGALVSAGVGIILIVVQHLDK